MDSYKKLCKITLNFEKSKPLTYKISTFAKFSKSHFRKHPSSGPKLGLNGTLAEAKIFDKSPVKLFMLRFSTKSVQAPSCRRPKNTQRTLFLSFEINNCFPITVYFQRLIKKSRKLACHVVNSNIAIGALPTLQTSHGLLALFEKIYYGEPIFTDLSNIGENAQYRCFN